MQMSKDQREWLDSHTKFNLGLSVDEIEAMQGKIVELEAENEALQAIRDVAQRLYRHEQALFEKYSIIYGRHDEGFRDCIQRLYAAVGDARVAGFPPKEND